MSTDDAFDRDGNVKLVMDEVVYEGHFRRNLMHGEGKLVFMNGTQYEGQFVDNHFDGNGTLVVVADHSEYKGEFKNGMEHGQGVLTFYNGIYTGDFVYMAKAP